MGTWSVNFEDDSASKIIVTVDGQASITKIDEPGMTISGRLEPLTGDNTSGWQFRIVDYQVTTMVTDFIAAGTAKIPVSSSAGFKIGSEVVIDAGSPAEESNRIIGFGSILLETPTQFDHEVAAIVSARGSDVHYRFKVENGKLVVDRSTRSAAAVEGFGVLVVSEGESKNDSASPAAAIVVVVAVLGALVVGVGIVLLFCKRRAQQNVAPTKKSDHASTIGVVSNPEHVETPKLLGALQAFDANSLKKSRGSLTTSSVEREASNIEEALEIAIDDSYEQLEISGSVDAIVVDIDTMYGDVSESQSVNDTQDVEEYPSTCMGDAKGGAIESVVAQI
jgi:hypothetical protein